MLVLENLGKHYAGHAAIDGVNLNAPAGSFTALLGPSGCGKSTTLRMIAGLDTPTSGRILIDGCDVTQWPPARRRIAMVFQSYALFPHLTVRENILFGLRVRKEPKQDYDRRLSRVAGLLGLGTLLDRKPAQLSGGQQQRVALGRAVISEAPICLMDEPLSNLDAQLRQGMRREIRGLQQELGITMIYVTHDQTEAMSMADQVVLLNAGRVEQQGTPDDLYQRPATPFTARFIGTPPMNLIAIEPRCNGQSGVSVISATRGADNNIGATNGTSDMRGAYGPAIIGAPEDARIMGLRPEHLRLDPSGIPAEIETVEYFGADSIVMCRVGSDNRVAVRVGGRLRAERGERVGLAWNPEHQHFFSGEWQLSGSNSLRQCNARAKPAETERTSVMNYSHNS